MIIDVNNKYFCYFLGIMWADGYLYSKGKTKYRVEITLVEEDLRDIEYIFDKIGDWKKYTRNRKQNNHKIQLNFRVSNKELFNFLIDNDYLNKSNCEPTKILNMIPNNNTKYFIRGLFDGDGCFYYKNNTRQCIFTSNYMQSWTYLSDFFKNIKCKHSTGRQQSNTGSRSFIRITSKDIIIFGDYIYDDFFGLKRKYYKYVDIKNSYNLPKKIRISKNRKSVCIEGILYKSITEASQLLNINRECLRHRLKSPNYNYRYN